MTTNEEKNPQMKKNPEMKKKLYGEKLRGPLRGHHM